MGPPPTPLAEAERRSLGVVELRQKAKAFALKTIDSQRTQFKRWAEGWNRGMWEGERGRRQGLERRGWRAGVKPVGEGQGRGPRCT